MLLSQDAVQTTGFIPESNNLWNGTRQSLVEDEWVDQARGLTIHSPALGNDERIRSIQNNAEGCGRTDVQMVCKFFPEHETLVQKFSVPIRIMLCHRRALHYIFVIMSEEMETP